uniref:Sushi domain-containing protein n=2 Tax=Wuchereria bancrofti TaxID=6293 RepID=A0AAF5Q335_WUCBA
MIWTKDTNETTKIYRIGSSELKYKYFTNTDFNSNEIFLNNGNPTACPKHCAFKLSTNIRTIDGVVLHQDNKERAPPPGYVDFNETEELFCARSFGDCGAKAPIYRYRNRNQLTKNNNYAYSFRANQLINGYIRELNPICYGWKDSNSKISDNEIVGSKDPTDCVLIPNIPNGQIIYKPSEVSEISETVMMGSFATLRCNEGYKPTTQNQVACITGTWYPMVELGECIPISTEIAKSCAPLPPHENGYILYSQNDTDKFPSGTLAYLICNGHYRSLFTRQAQCDHGQWSTLKLGSCQLITNSSCSPLPFVQNGKVIYLMGNENNITTGTVAELKCSPEYTINGIDALTCESNGWSPASTLGTCQKNIRQSDQREKRQEMRSCSSGHPIVSNGKLSYSNEPNIFGAYPSETVAIVRCNDGYTIYGALSSVCQDSIWKPSNLGVCIPSSTAVSISPKNSCLFGLLIPVGGTITYNKGGAFGPFPPGTIAKLECVNGISHGPASAVCDNGSWIPHEMGLCSLSNFENSSMIRSVSNCINDYPIPENGFVVYSNNANKHPPFAPLTRANVQCNPGYLPIGPVIAICHNGIWYPSMTTQCIQYNSGSNCVTGIAPPMNGYITYSTGTNKRPFSSGTVATISCDYGFKSVGAISSTCLNGIWSPLVLGQCVDTKSRLFGVPIESSISVTETKYCPPLVSPINGQIFYSNNSKMGTFPSGTVATVICNSNYIPLGLSTAVCTNGVFSPLLLANCVPEPKNVENLLEIRELPCIPLPKPTNGDLKYLNTKYSNSIVPIYTSKTVANLACNLGFVPVGPIETTCINGQWQPNLGFCQQSIIGPKISQVFIPGQCLFELPAIANGKIRYSSGNILPPYISGTTAVLICDSGVTPIGTKLSTCINGSWNPPILGQCPVNGYGRDYLRIGLKQNTLATISCSTSPPVSNGKIYYSNVSKNDKYAANTIANLICDDGYVLVGRSTSYCQGGIWSPWPGVGSCQPYEQHQQYITNKIKQMNVCSKISFTPTNGMIIYKNNENTTWYENGASAKLQCNPGYEIYGKQMTYCHNGIWIPSIGICQPIFVAQTKINDSCEPLKSPQNGKVYYIYNNYTKDYQIGTTAILNCRKGYRIKGVTTLICNSNGWTPNDGFGICIPADNVFWKH